MAFAWPAPAVADELSLPAQVGQKLFFDKSLSGSGKIACSSCHDPEHAYGPPNNLAVQPGGADLKLSGTRAVPSLRYTEATPPYADLLDNPDGISAPGPGGGLTQDGRAPTLADQAAIPLLGVNEMANRNPAAVVRKIRASQYAGLFREAYGAGIFANAKAAFRKVTEALQAFQKEDPSFHPYSSKYDLYAGNKIGGTFTAAEARGFAVYSDPAKGNCFACHYNGAGLNGSVALFTDFSYAAIGVPRNPEIAANRDPRYHDLGICSRPDHPPAKFAQFCGKFKTPTLRNVATRQVFFHNGKLKSLRDVIRFYNTRDTDPTRWYPSTDGVTQKFDDLPVAYRGNIDTQGPLDGRMPGSASPMSEQDMEDLEAFLGTLTDGYRAADPTRENFTTALETYLKARGQLCLGKFEWPIEVSERDRALGTGDARQMPVLETLGLVAGDDSGAAARRYRLTDEGRKFYLARQTTRVSPDGRTQVRHGDFCVASLSLDRIVDWEVPQAVEGRQRTTVRYTYQIAAAPWTREAEVRQVFPMVKRIVDGEQSLQLEQALELKNGVWVAVELEQ